MHLLTRCLIATTFAIGVASATPASAQAWPTKPIRLIINLAAGGITDQIARAFSTQLGEVLGQPIVIEYRIGAAGNVGAEAVAKSPSDGYTLLKSSAGPFVLSPHLYKLGFDPIKDLEPVTPTARVALLLVSRPGLPVSSVAELVAYARANPGKLNFGSSGNGSVPHVAGEMLLRAAGIRATHVPYKGVAPALTALLGDQIDFTFDGGGAAPYIKANRLRLLALSRSTRSAIFPDTPTMAEAGTDVDADTTQGVYAPAGTPKEIVIRLNREIARILQMPSARAQLTLIAAETVVASPEEFAGQLRRQRDRFGVIVHEANIRAD